MEVIYGRSPVGGRLSHVAAEGVVGHDEEDDVDALVRPIGVVGQVKVEGGDAQHRLEGALVPNKLIRPLSIHIKDLMYLQRRLYM